MEILMKKLILLFACFIIMANTAYAETPAAKAGDTAMENYTMNEGTAWMFGLNTNVKRANIAAPVIDIVRGENPLPPLFSLFQGFSYVDVFVPRGPDYQYDISEIIATEYEEGLEIDPDVWQTDQDPYFTWTLRVVGLDVMGYSVAFNEVPDQCLEVTEAAYQTPDYYLTDGKHIFYVVAKNTEGNFGQYGEFPIWVDATKPTISNTLPESGSIVSNARAPIQAILFDETSGIDAASIEIAITTELDTFTVSGNYDPETGLVAYVPTEDYPEGLVTVQMKVSDIAGNESTPSFWSFSVSSTAPSGWIVINNDDPVTEVPKISISLFADSSIATITEMIVSLDGIFDSEVWEPYVTSVDEISIPAIAGEHTVYVKFKDSSGSESGVYSDTIILVLAVADTFIISSPPSLTEDKDALIVYKSTLEDASFQYKLDNADWSDWSLEIDAYFEDLEDGNHYFQVRSGFDLDESNDIDADEIDKTPATISWTIGEFLSVPEDPDQPIRYYKGE